MQPYPRIDKREHDRVVAGLRRELRDLSRLHWTVSARMRGENTHLYNENKRLRYAIRALRADLKDAT